MAAPMRRDTWDNFVGAGYHDDAPGYPCGLCRDASDKCKRYFCVPCKEGSLCKEEFMEGRPHFQHDLAHGLLQVFKTSREYTVRKAELRSADVRRLLNTKIIMEFFSNERVVYYVKTRQPSTAQLSIFCEGCNQFVANARTTIHREKNQKSAKVCSVQCLLLYIQAPIQATVNYRNGHLRKQLKPTRSPIM